MFGAKLRSMLTLPLGYEEEDGDFQFTRVSKRKKTAPPVPEPAEPALGPALAPRRAKKQELEHGHEDLPVKKTRGRPMNFATPKAENESLQVPKKGIRKSARLSTEKLPNGENHASNSRQETTDHDSIDMVGAVGLQDTRQSPVDSSKHSTMIALPFSDTPIINRNKELRKKGTSARRSSLGMRGRRASSLIENGHSAIPHQEVETSEFYKHIEEGLPEPRRMRQLLTWTGERALPEKPALGDSDSAEKLAGESDCHSNWELD